MGSTARGDLGLGAKERTCTPMRVCMHARRENKWLANPVSSSERARPVTSRGGSHLGWWMMMYLTALTMRRAAFEHAKSLLM